MRAILLLLFILPLTIYCQKIKKEKNDFYFETSKTQWGPNDGKNIWRKNGNFAIIRIGDWKGDCCGNVPETERITSKIIKNTIFYNFNKKQRPNCDSGIGLCANAIDLVVNIKKHPNYRKLVFKEIIKY